MSWNGAGVFVRLYSWVADAAAGINISSTRTDADTNNITSNGFGNCLTRDGQGVATANLPMANFRHTGVGNGVARSDYAALGQAQDATINWVAAGGTADVITATYVPALTALVDGQLCFFRASAANATTTPTFSPNSLTARTITRAGGTALSVGDIPGALGECILRYNLANTRWELLNPATLVPGALSITTAMLQANAVTYAKIQQVTNNRFLGNFSGGSAVPSEYSLGNNLSVTATVLNVSTIPPASSFKNLSIKVATNTTVAVAADLVVMTDGSGLYRSATISATCDLGTNGAVNRLDAGTIAIDTWYHLFAISNGSTDGTLASTSATAPTMPSGYTYKAYIGSVQTIHASAILYGIWQLGRRAQYVAGLAGGRPESTATPGPIAVSGVGTYSATSPSLSAVTVAGNGKYVPTTASTIIVSAQTQWNGSGANANIIVAPSQSYSGANNGPNGSNKLLPPIHFSSTDIIIETAEILLESTAISIATQTGGAVVCQGWEVNI